MGENSTLNAEQRTQLVLRLLSKEEPAAQIARRAGVSEQTLYRWREDFISAGKQAMNGRVAQSKQSKAVERRSIEVAERDRAIGELTIANRLLRNSGALS